MPVITLNIPFIQRRKRAAATQAPPVALVLVAAERTEDPLLRLTFDRAIDISAIDLTQFEMLDGLFYSFRYVGYAPTTMLVGPATVEIGLNGVEDFTEPELVITVGAGNGIVAVDDEGTWAGVTDLELPFP